MNAPHLPRERPDNSGKLTKFHAIETTYRAFEFRSRLEAKWAVFFDLCGWPWSYEPLDLNGWIPDFAIGERPTLVEVKPFFRLEQYREAIAKIEASGNREPVILLPADPTMLGENIFGTMLGWQWSWFNDEFGGLAEDLYFGITEGNGLEGLCTMEGGWWNAVWNLCDKSARVGIPDHHREKFFVAKWALACNTSKWIPTR